MPPEHELRGGRLPARLADLANPPAVLYLHGELPRAPAVAIVGTRRPTPAAAEYARELAGELGAAGVAIISGGAAGIDTAAHQGALDVGAPTVVVAPSGFERPYPPQNAELFRQVVLSGGAYLTTGAAPTLATLPRFFERNGVLVALSHAVIVVEAPLRSGARNAAKTARQLGRPLFAVPAQPWNTNAQGCLAELQLGAHPLGSHREVLRLLEQMRLHAIALPPSHAARVVRMGTTANSDSDLTEPSESRASPRTREARAANGPARGAARRDRAVSRPRGDAATLLLTGDCSNSVGEDGGLVLDAVRAGALHADEVCAQTGLEAARVAQLLLTLTLDGRLVTDRAGRLRVLGE